MCKLDSHWRWFHQWSKWELDKVKDTSTGDIITINKRVCNRCGIFKIKDIT